MLTLQTETDLTFLGYFPARQDDTDRFRLWEVAGTAHADTYTFVTGMDDLGKDPAIADVILTTLAARALHLQAARSTRAHSTSC